MFTILRAILWLILSTCIVLIIRKSKYRRKKLLSIASVVLCAVLVSVSGMFPVENLFITYQSPERAFHYFQSEKIKEIIDGQESCLVIYNDGNSTYGYNIIPKTERGYKIPSYFEMEKVSHKFDKQAALDIYNAQGTQDYYVVGTVHQKDFDSNISVCNPAKEKIDTDIIRIENTNFICFWLPNFSNGYYLRINGEEIALPD
ncbi:MAG: hypothetical protein ACLU8W_07800 [Clostridia bacterium]